MAKISDDELLLIISRLPDPYGVPIIQAICAHVGPSRWLRIPAEWRVSAGMMYFQLDRLEKDGLLTRERSAETFPERGGRHRSYYRLTARGTRRVERYLATRVPVNEITGHLAVQSS